MLNTIHHQAHPAMLPAGGCALASQVGAAILWPAPASPAASPTLPPAASAGAATAASASAEATREVVSRFIDLLYRRRQVQAAFECCVVAHGYRDHAWQGRGSRAGAMRALTRRLADTALQAELLHLLVDGDMAMAHLRCQSRHNALHARVELYRVAHGRIVEHWSVCDQAALPSPLVTSR